MELDLEIAAEDTNCIGVVYTVEKEKRSRGSKLMDGIGDEATKNDVQKLVRNLHTYEKLSQHRNIVKLRRVTDDVTNERKWLILEYCDKGNLARYMSKNRLDLDQKISIILDIASVVCYLHSFNPPIIHGRIGPKNVFVKTEYGTDVAKLALMRCKDIRGRPHRKDKWTIQSVWSDEGSKTTDGDVRDLGQLFCRIINEKFEQEYTQGNYKVKGVLHIFQLSLQISLIYRTT